MELRDKSTLDIFINGEPAINSLQRLDNEFTVLKQKQKELVEEMRQKGMDEETIKASEAYRELSKEISANRREREGVRKEMDLESLSVKELRGLLRDLKKEYDAAVDPAVREELAKRIGTVNDQLDKVKLNIDKQESIWSSLKGWIIGAFTVTAAIEAGRQIITFLTDCVAAARKAEDAYADMAKSTGLSADEIKKLDNSLKQIDTRTSTEDLRQMTVVAGQLGIGLDSAGKVTSKTADEIAGFTRGIDKANVALGDEFKGGVEEVSKEIGTLQKLFGETRDMKVEEAIEKIGSTINELGAAGSAQGPEITNFTKRVAQMGELAPKSIAETMGLGAAMIELGSSAEISASGLKSVMGTAAAATGDFAKQVGMSEKEVRNLINTDPNAFLLKLAKSFEGATPTNMTVQMNNLGIKSQEAQGFMMMLATKTDFVAEKQRLANEAFKNGTSLQEEFNKKNENAAATYEKMQKELANVQEEIGQALLPSVTKLIGGFSDLIQWFKSATSEGQPLGVVLKGVGDVAKIVWSIVGGLGEVVWDLIKLFNPWIGQMDSTGSGMKVLATILYALIVPLKVSYSSILAIVEAFKLLISSYETVKKVIAGDMTISEGINAIKGQFNALKTNAQQNFGSIATDFKKIWTSSNAEAAKATAAVNAHGTAAANSQRNITDSMLGEIGKRAGAETKSDEKILSEKEVREQNRIAKQEAREAAKRQREQEKEKQKEEKIAAEALKSHEETQAKIDAANIAQIADERVRKITQLGWEYEQAWAKAQKEVKDKQQFIEWERTAQEKLKADIAKVDAEMNEKMRKESEATLKKQKEHDEELAKTKFATSKAILDRQLLDTTLSVTERRRLEIELQTLQTNYELEQLRIRHQAAVEKAKLAGQDTTELEKKYNAEKELLNAQHNAKVQAIEAETLEKRKQNQQAFFDALKGLMNGDYTAALDILNKKFANEKAKNNAELQQFNNKTQQIGEMAVQGLQMLQSLNQKYLESQLNKIAKEKDTQLKSWEAQYKAGKISKEEYEKQVAKINADAAEKEKQEKLKAWKRDQQLQIAMAIAHGAMAALKSLATLGWPLGLVAVAGAAIATGIQIAIIKSQRPPDFQRGGILRKLFDRGGYVRNAGVPDGPGHGSQYGTSGIALVRRDTGQEVGEMEGDEPIMILSRNTYRNNKPTIDKLLHSSLHRNGAPIYESGGVMYSDGGDYRSYLKPLKKGKQYYAGTDFEESGGGGSDFGSSGGSSDFNPNVPEPSGGSYDDNPSYPSESESGYVAASANSDTQAQIAESQAMMTAIGKNTGDTVAVLNQMMGKLNDMHGTLNSISYYSMVSANKPTLSAREISDAVGRSGATASQSTFA